MSYLVKLPSSSRSTRPTEGSKMMNEKMKTSTIAYRRNAGNFCSRMCVSSGSSGRPMKTMSSVTHRTSSHSIASPGFDLKRSKTVSWRDPMKMTSANSAMKPTSNSNPKCRIALTIDSVPAHNADGNLVLRRRIVSQARARTAPQISTARSMAPVSPTDWASGGSPRIERSRRMCAIGSASELTGTTECDVNSTKIGK